MKGILWKELVFMRSRLLVLTLSSSISPLLYLLTFGWGVGRSLQIQGHLYLEFVLPGILSLTSALAAYNATAMRVNVARIHESTFESLLVSPTRISSIAMGYILAGALRGLHASLVVFLATLVVVPENFWNLGILPSLLLDCLTFSALGYLTAVCINNHYNMNLFNSYGITPMVFLCGTFFPIERFPDWLQPVIHLLPLSLASNSIREITWKNPYPWHSNLYLGAIFILLMLAGIHFSTQEQNS